MDNRTPPPGIEVIGELPPGVPWWDAERLVVRPPVAAITFLSIVGLAILGGCIWIATVLYQIYLQAEGATAFLVLTNIIAVCLIAMWGLVTFLAGAGYLFVRYHWVIMPAHIQHCAPFSHLWRKVSGKRAARTFRLERIDELRMIDSKVRIPTRLPFPIYARGYAVVFVSDVAGRPRPISLGYGRRPFPIEKFRALLAYRIAKAKGETPPPPEFS